jgi:hypothetical protein
MDKHIKLYIGKLQWIFLTNNLKQVAQIAPAEDWELETYVIAECYKRLLHKFTFFPTNKNKTTISLKLSEATAINNFFAPQSSEYNIFIRPHLEPHLKPSNKIDYAQV